MFPFSFKYLSIFQVCDFHGCLKKFDIGNNLSKKEGAVVCAGQTVVVEDLTGLVDGIPELNALLNRGWLHDTTKNRKRTICQQHRDFFTKEYFKHLRNHERCLCPCDHKGSKRNQKKIVKLNYEISSQCLAKGLPYTAFLFPVCANCLLHIEEKLKESGGGGGRGNPASMDIDPEPPEPGPSWRSSGSSASSSSSSSDEDDNRDRNYSPSEDDDNDHDDSKDGLAALNNFYQQTKKKTKVKSRLMMSYVKSDPSRKRKLQRAVADGIDSILCAISPYKQSRFELYQATVQSQRVEKKISNVPVMPKDVMDVIDYHNFVKDRDEKIRAIATLLPRHSHAFLKLFNSPQDKAQLPNDDEVSSDSEDDQMELDDVNCGRFWDPPLTYARFRAADIHRRYTGYGMAPITKKIIRRPRIKTDVVRAIYNFVTSSAIMQRTAFGTYKLKTSDGSLYTVAKHIRNCSQAELTRKIRAYCHEVEKFDEKDIPQEGYIRKILTGVPAIRSKNMKGISGAVEYGK